MTTYILLEINDVTEADELIEDSAEYPDMPLLTPCLENTVYAKIVFVGKDLQVGRTSASIVRAKL